MRGEGGDWGGGGAAGRGGEPRTASRWLDESHLLPDRRNRRSGQPEETAAPAGTNDGTSVGEVAIRVYSACTYFPSRPFYRRHHRPTGLLHDTAKLLLCSMHRRHLPLFPHPHTPPLPSDITPPPPSLPSPHPSSKHWFTTSFLRLWRCRKAMLVVCPH